MGTDVGRATLQPNKAIGGPPQVLPYPVIRGVSLRTKGAKRWSPNSTSRTRIRLIFNVVHAVSFFHDGARQSAMSVSVSRTQWDKLVTMAMRVVLAALTTISAYDLSQMRVHLLIKPTPD